MRCTSHEFVCIVSRPLKALLDRCQKQPMLEKQHPVCMRGFMPVFEFRVERCLASAWAVKHSVHQSDVYIHL